MTGPMIEVRDQPDESRYEVLVDGELAGFARYVVRGGRLVFVHTEVDDAYEGRGIGTTLASGALDDARARGMRILPLCPFIAAFIERHPQYDDLVDHEKLAHLDRS